MGKIRKVNRNDNNRVLLSEVLPYEVPIIFSNEGYYDFLANEDENSPEVVRELLFKPTFQIPFNYRIKKNAFAYRTLSIMHPLSQKRIVNFYSNYDLLILHLCNKSPVSLRHPSQVASMFYDKETSSPFEEVKGEELIEVEVDFENKYKEKRHSSSYFKYKKYDLLLKFYDSYEFIRLEKKYKYLLKFDVSNCFNSIYTHSISWAVKDKMFAKKYKSRSSFEKEFDELMQNANHGETNGIIIGPEVSRIFAEIILQRIDLNAINKLSEKNLIRKQEYDLRRYVDDYFIFTNDESIGRKILKVFEEELEIYKLYINKSKTEESKVPFISGITISRTHIRKLLEDFFSSSFEKYLIDVDENYLNDAPLIKKPLRVKGSYSISNKLILDLKCIIKTNNVEYESVSRLSFSIVKRKLNILFKKVDSENLDEEQFRALSEFLLNIYDFLFFLFSMDNCVRVTYVMTQIIVATNQFLEKFPEDHIHIIKKKIFDESLYLIKNIKAEDEVLGVEVLNLLIALKDLGEEYSIEQNLLSGIMDFKLDNKSICYFHFIVALYYIKDDIRYSNLRQNIEKHLIYLFEQENYIKEKAEIVCLFFDMMACPYIQKAIKESLVVSIFKKLKSKTPSAKELNQINKFFINKNWFVDWSEDINLDFLLSKKELSTPY